MAIKIICLAFYLLLGVGNCSVFAEDEPATVEGHVTTTWGASLAEVKVSFYLLEGTGGISKSEKLIQQVKTDEQGNYKVVNLPWGQYRVEFIDSIGHSEVWRFYLWRSAKRVLDMCIPLGYTHFLSLIQVSGEVLQDDGVPIPDATISMISAYNPNDTQQVRTDKNGIFQVSLIQPGQYIFGAVKEGFMAESKAVDLGNGEKTTVKLVLKSGKTKGAFNFK